MKPDRYQKQNHDLNQALKQTSSKNTVRGYSQLRDRGSLTSGYSRRAKRQVTSFTKPLVSLGALWIVAFGFLLLLALQKGVPYDQLLLDSNYLNDLPWHAGLISNIGLLAWCTAAVAGFFGGWVSRFGNRPNAAKMLRGGALLSSILLLDDMFQLHTLFRPVLNLPKASAFLLYFVLASAWAYSNMREIMRTRLELLIGAGLAFAASLFFDQLAAPILSLSPSKFLIAEDASKFLGVLAWAQYFVLTSGDIVRSILMQLEAKAIARHEE